MTQASACVPLPLRVGGTGFSLCAFVLDFLALYACATPAFVFHDFAEPIA
jgi:hypothetical protein